MPEVDRQVRQPLLDIEPLAMPPREPGHCEGVSEGMERRSAVSRRRLDAGMVEQPPKRAAGAGVVQAPTQARREEGRRRSTAQGRRSRGNVGPQVIGRRRMEDDHA